MVNCKYCNAKTRMESTKMCDPCYEIDSKIRYNFERATMIFELIKSERSMGVYVSMVGGDVKRVDNMPGGYLVNAYRKMREYLRDATFNERATALCRRNAVNLIREIKSRKLSLRQKRKTDKKRGHGGTPWFTGRIDEV